jgi:cell wall-associated NlpC family hydrolase
MHDLIGKPFKDRGRGPDSYDCWGLALEIFKRFGKELPNYKICCSNVTQIHNQIEISKQEWIKCEGEPPIPSLVVMKVDDMGTNFCNHTGVYIGEGQFMHTLEKTGVVIARINHPYWRLRIEGFYKPGW